MKPYPAYKESEVRWIREIPAHWDIRRLRLVAHVISGSTPQSGVANYWDGEITWVTPADLGRLSDKWIVDSDKHITDHGLQSCGTTLVPKGSVVLSTRAPIGHVALAAAQLCTNQGCKSVVPGDGIDCVFTYYVLRAVVDELRSLGTGTTFRELATHRLRDLRLAVPPLFEQTAIVTYLDRKNAEIDQFIRKKRQLVAMLNEQKAAIINRAVTKGSDPGVSMRTSGLAWIGEIPAHWRRFPLKRIAKLQTGVTLGKTYPGETAEFPYLRVANVQSGYFDLADVATIRLPPADADRYRLLPGDVLITEGGDPDKLGRGFVWDGQVPGCLHQNHIFAIRPQPGLLEPHFLAALLQSEHGRNYFMYTAKQTTNLASTNSTTLKQFRIPLPGIQEQRRILEFIRKASTGVSQVIYRTEREIELINEYRTALISAAVTGKIDVRDAVSRAGTDVAPVPS